MTLKLILAVTLIAVAPTVAFAQKDDPVDQAPSYCSPPEPFPSVSGDCQSRSRPAIWSYRC